MFSIEALITVVFCCVDDLLAEINHSQPIRARGFAPALTQSEVISMAIVAEFLGIDADQSIWRYFHHHWLSLFSQLARRSRFARQAATDGCCKSWLQQRLAGRLGAFADDGHLIDGRPIPLCCFSRAPSCRSFQAEAAYGYCAAKQQTYYGVHGHLLVSMSGVSCGSRSDGC